MLFISPNNTYPVFYGDLQSQYPDWKVGDPTPEGWRLVSYSDQPELGENEIAYEEFPIEIDGEWKQNWQVRAMTDEEVARKNAPETAKAKLQTLDLTDDEKDVIRNGVFL